jgi:hypothetical protein
MSKVRRAGVWGGGGGVRNIMAPDKNYRAETMTAIMSKRNDGIRRYLRSGSFAPLEPVLDVQGRGKHGV